MISNRYTPQHIYQLSLEIAESIVQPQYYWSQNWVYRISKESAKTNKIAEWSPPSWSYCKIRYTALMSMISIETVAIQYLLKATAYETLSKGHCNTHRTERM